jgi:hypothetical protein
VVFRAQLAVRLRMDGIPASAVVAGNGTRLITCIEFNFFAIANHARPNVCRARPNAGFI